MSSEPVAIAIARDIAIIILCLESIVFLLVMLFIGWRVSQLVSLFRSKAEEYGTIGRALLENARETAHTASETATAVRGSVDFITDTVVAPVVQVVSAVTGARSFVSAFFRLPWSSRKGGGT